MINSISKTRTASPIALIFKRTDAIFNKYAPSLKCVTDDYKNAMLF